MPTFFTQASDFIPKLKKGTYFYIVVLKSFKNIQCEIYFFDDCTRHTKGCTSQTAKAIRKKSVTNIKNIGKS